jgi:hypothetical protein
MAFVCRASGVGGDLPTGRQAQNADVRVFNFMRFKEWGFEVNNCNNGEGM